MTEASLPGFDRPVHAVVQGASRGLGLAFVRHLLDDSNVAKVLATCRRPEHAGALQDLVDTSSGRVILAAVDVTDEESIAEAAAYARENLGEVHLLLNVAGVLHDKAREMEPEKKLDDIDPDDLLYAFQVNSAGPLLMVKHFSSLIPRKGRAVIANLSARVGSIGDNRLGGWYAYRASKAAQNMFTRTVAIELGRHRRRGELICVALHPGTVDTDLSRPFQSHVPDKKLFDPPRAARQLLDVIAELRPEDSGNFFDWAGEPVPW